MSVSSVYSSLTGRAEQDSQVLQDLGGQLNSKEDAFNKAVTTGDPAKIAKAQTDFQRANQALSAKMSAMEAVNHLIDQIIARVGQIGQ